jgi:citrate lyase beta subunit
VTARRAPRATLTSKAAGLSRVGDTTIPDNALSVFVDALDKANVRVAQQFPGDSPKRQPVHVVYGGAHLFKADAAQKLGAVALEALQEHAPDAASLAGAIGLDRALADRIYVRVIEKLTREPVEDFRIDFEDGFGNRPDHEEDGFAQIAANEVAAGLRDRTLPPSIGIRIKPLNEELKRRSLRTFDMFLTRLLERSEGRLPPNFVVTLPKITAPEQVAALASACDAFEYWRELPAGTLKFELMVETTQSIFGPDGSVALPRLVAEGGGRIVAAHFGTYDYTAACGITAAHQHMRHPVCDFAKHVMQVAVAGTGIWLSDGATNVMPIGPSDVVHRAWRLHADHVRHSLVTGFYQGWDLHPAQLPSRFAAVFAFFLEGLDAASERLQNFVRKAAQATLVGDVFDDAATGQGLLNYFLRAVNCGAITEHEAVEKSGLTLDELRSRSFVMILKSRASR